MNNYINTKKPYSTFCQNKPQKPKMIHWKGWYAKTLAELQRLENRLAHNIKTTPKTLIVNSKGLVVSANLNE